MVAKIRNKVRNRAKENGKKSMSIRVGEWDAVARSIAKFDKSCLKIFS